jgi:hypothetical protein
MTTIRWTMLVLLAAALLAGCPSDDDDSAVVDDDDTGDVDDDDTGQIDDDDSATPDDDDSAAPDDDDSAGPVIEQLLLDVSAAAITSREILTVTVTAVWSDGLEVDVTQEATVLADDPEILRFYEPGTGQPLLGGTTALTAALDGHDSSPVEVTVTVVAAGAADLVFNELLTDGAVDGDPNGDGSLDSVEDEFVEIANVADATVALDDVTFVEIDFPFLPRHTFAPDTFLRAGEAIVLFGGGDVSALGEPFVQFVVVDNDDPGVANGLSLKNTGDVLTLVAADGATVITELAYGDESDGSVPAPSDESAVLEPEVWGTDYVLHSLAAGALGAYSPGALADGATFEGPDGRYAP